MVNDVFLLFVIYQLKHFLADYVFQLKFMAMGKAKTGLEWVVPLSAHAGVHALFTLAIVTWWRPEFWWLAGADFGIHFLMDRIKSSPQLMGKFRMGTHLYWGALGFDQMVHHLTHIWIIWVLVTH